MCSLMCLGTRRERCFPEMCPVAQWWLPASGVLLQSSWVGQLGRAAGFLPCPFLWEIVEYVKGIGLWSGLEPKSPSYTACYRTGDQPQGKPLTKERSWGGTAYCSLNESFVIHCDQLWALAVREVCPRLCWAKGRGGGMWISGGQTASESQKVWGSK